MPFVVGLIALAVAALGVAVGFLGQWLEISGIAVAGFVIAVIGIGTGFAAVLVGQLLYGATAICGSWKAMWTLRRRVLQFLGLGPSD